MAVPGAPVVTTTPWPGRESTVSFWAQVHNAEWQLTGTVLDAESNDLGGISRGGARLVRAVTNAITEVDILAQADNIGGRASKLDGLAQHVRDTDLLKRG